MVDSFGISAGGRSAEQLFFRLTGAIAAPKASIGDALLEGYPVEIKRATSTTLNQVRAVKFIPIAAYHEPTAAWFVIPAHMVVVHVSLKRRGQHTENPFESATLSLSNLGDFRIDREDELRQRTLVAIESALSYGSLKAEMEWVLEASKLLAEESVDRVRASLDELGLTVAGARIRRAPNAGAAREALRELFEPR